MRRPLIARPSTPRLRDRRPLVRSGALATALAAELAVGTLLVAPSARADEAPTPGEDPTAATIDPPIRTGRTDDVPPAPAEPAPAPDAPASPVRTGRFDDVPASGEALAGDTTPADSPDGASTQTPDREVAPRSDRAADELPGGSPSGGGRAGGGRTGTDLPGSDQSGTDQSGSRSSGGRDRASGTSTPSASEPPTSAPGTAPTPPAPAAPLAHTVVSGDNLWEIAAAHLATVSGRPRVELGALDIAPYWTRVCMTNRPHLISGDVSLIYTGEQIELPAV
jgi:hypothetical protein